MKSKWPVWGDPGGDPDPDYDFDRDFDFEAGPATTACKIDPFTLRPTTAPPPEPMEQERLREFERRCIQEEPPECTAACPLHVDARAFAGHVVDGAWDKALKILRAAMPFPGLVGRVCHGPCRDRCRRGDAGDPIQVHLLEAACVARPAPAHRVMPLPSRGKSVAVAGTGLSSLTAAWDLARKGYGVTLFEPGPWPGEPLTALAPAIFTRELIEKETAVLFSLKVEVVTGADVTAGDFIEKSLGAFDALYLGLDAIHTGPLAIAGGQQTTSQKGVFAGGAGRGEMAKPVWQCAEGRWAAVSVDRFLQKVSMTAGREKEGPFATRLFTSLEDVASEAAVVPADPDRGYTDAEAIQEAGRCLLCQCLECVKVCKYLEAFGAYPKKYAREIYNNEAIVMGERKANRLINSCSLCGLCETVCPHDFAMADLCLAARQGMVERAKMPPSAHQFALEDLAFSQSDRFALARHEPGRNQSRYLFFPGCQLCASSPRIVPRVYDHLRKTLSGGVALELGCCGAPAHWAGQEEIFSQGIDAWQARWEAMGRPQPVMACATCLSIFKGHLPRAGAVSLWEMILEKGLPDDAGALPQGPLAVHDPCTTRGEEPVQTAVRTILSRLGGVAEELALGRDKTECCGFGGLMQDANPALAAEVAALRGSRSDSDYLAYCAMCRDNLAGAGKRALHLLDLLFPDSRGSDPAGRPRPGWSRRRENRSRLRADLLSDLWGQAPDPEADWRKIELVINAAVAGLLDSRRILAEDIQRVIFHAEAGGDFFCHGESGHRLGMSRPHEVTFWVAYRPAQGGGFAVHNAWAHRMEVLGP